MYLILQQSPRCVIAGKFAGIYGSVLLRFSFINGGMSVGLQQYIHTADHMNIKPAKRSTL